MTIENSSVVPMVDLMAHTETAVPSMLSCPKNCSHHGTCTNGVCTCKMGYEGRTCDLIDSDYYIILGAIFLLLSFVSFVQLVTCIGSEYRRLTKKSWLEASRITTQKCLYFFTCMATASRGAYFIVIIGKDSSPSPWMTSLLSAYYPLLISGSSLLVCFWAEEFHLHFSQDRQKPRFLTKSYIAFIVFNIVLYVLLGAEIVSTNLHNTDTLYSDYLASVFNAVFAGFMVIVVIMFLIYGVEVYFKIHGAFAGPQDCKTNRLQLNMSRFGLLAQACLLLMTAIFLISDILRKYWHDSLPTEIVKFLNNNDLVLRIFEFGLALWFSCVLWNCSRPDKLWVLNPRRILRDSICSEGKLLLSGEGSGSASGSHSTSSAVSQYGAICDNSTCRDCWICYDPLRKDAGSFICPCLCKGDMSFVHHDCLRRWLLEYSSPDDLYCKVCRQQYSIKNHQHTLLRVLSKQHWAQTIIVVIVMGALPVVAAILWGYFGNVLAKISTIMGTFIAEYICLKLLGFSVMTAYQKVKMSAMEILGNPSHNAVDANVKCVGNQTQGRDNPSTNCDNDGLRPLCVNQQRADNILSDCEHSTPGPGSISQHFVQATVEPIPKQVV